jgi:DNA-binding response OmpR family regulator
MKVLIIDDDPDIRLIVRVSLSRHGFTVAEAVSGPDGLRAARDDRPDVIVLDVMMPEMDGPATLRALLADPAVAGIPVVFLTAKAMRSEVDRLRALGAAGVLLKPFDPLSLAAELEAVLRGTGASRTKE